MNEAAFTPEQLAQLEHQLSERAMLRFTPSILIVEDQEFSLRLIEDLLKKQYLCFIAKTGAEAIRLYAENAPCITFLDIGLPDIDGHALAELFRQHDPHGHLIMVTANKTEADVQRAKDNKVQGYLAKPYKRQKILEAVERYKHEGSLPIRQNDKRIVNQA